MFEEETVFILGAGASWHYGYPTGEDLVKKVIEKSRSLRNYLSFDRTFKDITLLLKNLPSFIVDKLPNKDPVLKDVLLINSHFIKKCNELEKRLKIVNPPVIDYFIKDNHDLEEIGKILISMVITECEIEYFRSNISIHNSTDFCPYINPNRTSADQRELLEKKQDKDKWLRFIVYKLLQNSQKSRSSNSKHHLLDNKVSFITFNYDTSLEDEIYQALSQTEVVKKFYDQFFSEERFIHIYGRVNSDSYSECRYESIMNGKDVIGKFNLTEKLPNVIENANFQDDEKARYFETIKNFLDKSYCASQGIKIIGDHKHNDDAEVKEIANIVQKLIKSAKFIYILGYGFDEQNNQLLGLNILNNAELPYNSKFVMFTNFGDSNRINKKTGALFLDNPNAFSTSGRLVLEREDDSGPYCYYHYEKSVRNVYDAFAYDFDAI